MQRTASTPSRSTISCKVKEELKTAFTDYCQKHGRNESVVLRHIIKTLIGDHKVNALPVKKENKTRRITINLTAQEMEEIERRYDAEGFGSRTEWATSCVLGRLHDDPVLTQDEINALRESCRQLRYFGTNLNQIARAMNIDLKEQGEVTDLEKQKVSSQLLISIRQFVIQHADKMQQLVIKNRRRWQ